MNLSPLDGNAGSGDIQDSGDVTAVTQAVGGIGLITGRAVGLASVVLLDPTDWA